MDAAQAACVAEGLMAITAGDNVLKAVSGALRGAIRDIDQASRYGGEEFAVILPHTTVEGGARLAVIEAMPAGPWTDPTAPSPWFVGFHQIPEVVLCDSNFGMLREDEQFLESFIKTRETSRKTATTNGRSSTVTSTAV